jgi:hypothetical protein
MGLQVSPQAVPFYEDVVLGMFSSWLPRPDADRLHRVHHHGEQIPLRSESSGTLSRLKHLR